MSNFDFYYSEVVAKRNKNLCHTVINQKFTHAVKAGHKPDWFKNYSDLILIIENSPRSHIAFNSELTQWNLSRINKEE